MSFVWIRPSFGLWFGLGQAAKDGHKNSGGLGYVIGNYAVQIGLLLGFNIGFGRKWGFFTGLVGAIALIPFWQFGFIGLPIGFHIKKRFGIGIVIPIYTVDPWISLFAAIGLFAIGLVINLKTEKKGISA